MTERLSDERLRELADTNKTFDRLTEALAHELLLARAALAAADALVEAVDPFGDNNYALAVERCAAYRSARAENETQK